MAIHPHWPSSPALTSRGTGYKISLETLHLHQRDKESLQKPGDLQSTPDKSILAGLSLWPCLISLHILYNAFVVHPDDIVMN